MEESQRRLGGLRAEISDWTELRCKLDTRKQFATQLHCLDSALVDALGCLSQAANKLDPGSVGEAYELCRAFDDGLLTVRRLWRWFADKFGGGQYACIYAGAMRAANGGNAPPSSPLAYLDDLRAPEAVPRDLVPAQLQPDRFTEALQAMLARLPIPVVGLPAGIADEPWQLAAYLGDLGRDEHPTFSHYWGLPPQSGGPYQVGSLWFVAALLAFSLAYALLRRVRPLPVSCRWSGVQVMVAAALLIAVAVGLMWQRWQLGDADTFMKMQWGEWPQGAGLFALGVWARQAGSLENLTAWARRLGWTALIAAALWAALAVYVKTTGHLESAFHGAGWLVILNVLFYGIISVAFTVWFTALIRARWSGGGPLRARAGRASYAAYVLHSLVLTAVMVAFASLALAPELAFLVVAVVAVPACFLAGYSATQVPGLAKVL